MAAQQREISVAEFFLKNRHLLGFDTPARALLTAVKEAVDNSLDACEEARILPEVWVEIDALDTGRFRVAVQDNGPGIAREQVARIFGKLLYGSKFHRLAQSRGQQGMGISAAGMYAQLTTGVPTRVVTRVAGQAEATEMLVTVDTQRNRPDIRRRRQVQWAPRHGTRVELELEGQYQHGQHSVLLYLKLVSIVNPHVSLHLREPDGTQLSWPRQLRRRPAVPRRIKPHPAGVELGVLMSMLKQSQHRRLGAFLREEFSQVGDRRAREIIERAGQRLTPRSSTRRIRRDKAEALLHAIAETDVPAPPTDCVVPIGQQGLLRGLEREVPGRFMTAVSRRPAVYRGNPFVVEVALSHGRQDGPHVEVDEHGHLRRAGEPTAASPREPVRLLRFANRVPLLYQQSHCAITQAVSAVHWSRYGLQQPPGGLPLGPMTVLVHVASVWVPFTSESKEAVAAYPEIARELSLALQHCGRKLAAHLSKERKLEDELQRRSEIEKYLPHVGQALQALLDLDDARRAELVQTVDALLQEKRRLT
ncbi:MAG: DNA topoisomerase VI subunit B [Myxococcales bacterium]